jgi:glycosyltransferase involved in cell wall biosynthesis
MAPTTPAASPVVDVLVPAHNEAAHLESHLDELRTVLAASPWRWRLIVVDDGSTDGTAAAAERFAARDGDTRLLRHPRNRGLGAALRTGFAAADGDVVVTLDADLSYAPEVAPRLVERLLTADADLVVASPYRPDGSVAGVPWLRLTLSRAANRLLGTSLAGALTAPTCLARAYSRRAVRELRFASDGTDALLEIVADVVARGLVVGEIPARLEWRGDAEARARRIGWPALAAYTVRVLRWSVRLRRALPAGERGRRRRWRDPHLAPGVKP